MARTVFGTRRMSKGRKEEEMVWERKGLYPSLNVMMCKFWRDV
jgi:hypothetical protein